MGILSILVSVTFLIYMLLRISRMVGGGQAQTLSSTEHYDARPGLPDRSEEEVRLLLASMPTKWITYMGATPPLRLKIRALTEELYRRFTRSHLDAYGQDVLDQLPLHQKMELMKTFIPDINARAYVLDWEGAKYPNGNPLPFSSDRLAVLMRNDELLKVFVTDESWKLSEEHGLSTRP